MIMDAAGERSEQGRFISDRLGSTNAVSRCPPLGYPPCQRGGVNDQAVEESVERNGGS
jgi:hypothetical protein